MPCLIQLFCVPETFSLPLGLCSPYVTRKTVSKNGATIAKATFITVCAWQWNI